MIEELPSAAKHWVRSLSPAARTEIDRRLRETGTENFSKHWRKHKAELEEAERSFGRKL
jgi:hypothetical protein